MGYNCDVVYIGLSYFLRSETIGLTGVDKCDRFVSKSNYQAENECTNKDISENKIRKNSRKKTDKEKESNSFLGRTSTQFGQI